MLKIKKFKNNTNVSRDIIVRNDDRSSPNDS